MNTRTAVVMKCCQPWMQMVADSDDAIYLVLPSGSVERWCIGSPYWALACAARVGLHPDNVSS